jgi:hypothetical protein
MKMNEIRNWPTPISPSGVEGCFRSANSDSSRKASTPLGQNGLRSSISANPLGQNGVLLLLLLGCRSVTPAPERLPELDVYTRTSNGEVHRVGRFGETPAPRERWFLKPIDPQVDLGRLARALAGKQVPGLALPATTHTQPEALRALCTLDSLQWLDLSRTTLDRAALEALSTCHDLDALVLDEAVLDDAALEGLRPLRSLDAKDTALTDRSARRLASWPRRSSPHSASPPSLRWQSCACST